MSFFDRFKKKPRELFLDFDPAGTHWRVVTWNFDLKDPSMRRWNLEIYGEKSRTITWEQTQKNQVSFYLNKKLTLSKSLSESETELKSLMNLAIHSTLKFSLESNHEFILTPVSGTTAMDIQDETRSLQWIEVSFGTLKRAFDAFKNDRSVILSGACFSGIVPETGEEVLRLIAFNLDIFYYFRLDKSLQIVVFDDKNLGHGSVQQATFNQVVKLSKPQFYDEMAKLLHYLANMGEIR